MSMPPASQSHVPTTMQSTSHSPSPAPGSSRKRPITSRPIISCEECRRRKIGCSKTFPCTNCVRLLQKCVYANQDPGRKQLRSRPSVEAIGGQTDQWMPGPSGSEVLSEELSASPGRLLERGVTDLYVGDDDFPKINGLALEPDLDDICLQVGKLTLAERIDGVLRSNILSIVNIPIQLMPVK